jgi:hypothetical protein
LGWQRRHSVPVEQSGHGVGGGLIPGRDEVAVSAKGHGWILSEAAGDRDDIHAGAEKLGGDVVPEIVEAYRDSDPVSKADEPAGHSPGINGSRACKVGTEDERVLDQFRPTCEGSLHLSFVLLSQKVEGDPVE